MKTTLAERLKLARKEQGLSQKALGELIGVSQAAIQKIEVGKAKETTKILDLANALGVRPEWLSSGDGEMRETPSKTNRESSIPPEHNWGTVDAWDGSTPLPEDEVEVPFLKDIELACGDGSYGEDDYNGFMLRFSKATLKRVGAQKGSVLCFPAHGNSMEPLIPEGSTVAINLLDKKIVDGKVYAINQDGWKRLKALHRSGPNKVIIRSFNSAEYDDEEADIDQIEILGRMFWTSTLW
ncbi:XRE family transcriptional regulator [Serratia marcescens]|uniref:XRE family transcriptional regulator n=1 Tax=Serratia marcescens TaxID=615 RepID=UPI0009517819|nr:helix-turn-helix transcriptional regulator [Serratia marcescens]